VLRASVRNLAAGAALGVLIVGEDCDTRDCLAGPAPSVEWALLPGGSYHVVVDGTPGATFDLTLDCGREELDCTNGRDDDADGFVDCADPHCRALDPACREADCDDASDDDRDGFTDCGDPDCLDTPECGGEVCDNGVDDDGDTLADCYDDTCFAFARCDAQCTADALVRCDRVLTGTTAGVASEIDDWPWCATRRLTGGERVYELTLEDNALLRATLETAADLDLLLLRGRCGVYSCVEAADTALEAELVAGDRWFVVVDGPAGAGGAFTLTLACGQYELSCADDADDDGDGHVDCADLDCVGTASCRESLCGDAVDDDGDGATDCADPDCRTSALCFEVACANGSDDDADDLADCDDLDCAETPACAGEVCQPGRALACGTSLSQDLRDATATSAIGAWPTCDLFGLDHGGAELAFDLPVPCTGLYTVRATPTGGAPGFLDLLLLDGERGCTDEACTDMAYGEAAGATLTFEALAGDRHTLVVDGVDGFEGPFELELDCGGCQPLVETVCDDLADDDGDRATDCADSDCAGARACEQTCRPRGALACGDPAAGTLGGPTATDRNDRYPCDRANQDYDGPEDTWSFVSPCTGPVTVTTVRTAGSRNRDTFVLRAEADGGCAPETCAAVGYMSEAGVGQVVFGALAGARYYVVVDSADGPPASYTLTVTCGCLGETDCRDGFDDDGDGRIDCLDSDCAGAPQCASAGQCSPIAALTCDVPVDGDTSVGGADRVDGWSCSGLAETGKEQVYRWVATQTGLVAAVLDIDGGFDLDLFVLEDLGGGCNPNACIVSSTRTSDEIAAFVAIAGRTYYIVVDGYGTAEGPYRLQMDCSPGCEVSGTATCDGPIDGDLSAAGTSDNVGAYRCDAAQDDYSGAELFYEFELPCSGAVDVRLRRLGGSGRIDLVRLAPSPVCDGTCAEIAKMDGGTGEATLPLRGERGARFLLAVDGRDGFEGPFRLEFDCRACLSEDPCFGADETWCGATFAGTTAGAEGAFEYYGCSPVAWPGGERWRRFVPTQSGRVTLSLSSEDPGLGVMLIEDSGEACDPFACVAGSDWRIPGAVTATVEAGQGYLVVVDGQTIEGATFNLDVECP